MATAWYEQWFDEDYLLVYSHRDSRDAGEAVELYCKAVFGDWLDVITDIRFEGPFESAIIHSSKTSGNAPEVAPDGGLIDSNRDNVCAIPTV